MNLADHRANGRRGYELAVAMIRWDNLRAAYVLAKERRRGQRKAWRALRSHVAGMMRDGV